MEHKIHTRRISPPIPVDPFWIAWSDNLGEEDSPYGEGPTEDAAIVDLNWKLLDLED